MCSRYAYFEQMKKKRMESNQVRSVKISERDLIMGTTTLNGKVFIQNACMNTNINTNIADPIFVVDPVRFFDQFRLTVRRLGPNADLSYVSPMRRDVFSNVTVTNNQMPSNAQRNGNAMSTDQIVLRPLVDHINPYMIDNTKTQAYFDYTSKVWSGEYEPNWRDSEPSAIMSAAWRQNLKESINWQAFAEPSKSLMPPPRIDDLICKTRIGTVRIPHHLTITDASGRRLNTKIASHSLQLITGSIVDVALQAKDAYIDAEIDDAENENERDRAYATIIFKYRLSKARQSDKCVICKQFTFSAGNTACRHMLVCRNCLETHKNICILCMNQATLGSNVLIFREYQDAT